LRTVELNPRCLQEAIEELTYSALETNTIVDSKIKAASFQQLDSLEANAITRSNRTVSPLALLTAILTFNKTYRFHQNKTFRRLFNICHDSDLVPNQARTGTMTLHFNSKSPQDLSQDLPQVINTETLCFL
jgi:hypothetical protein